MASYKINSLGTAYSVLNSAAPKYKSSDATKKAYAVLKNAASNKTAVGKQITLNLEKLNNMGDFDEKKSAYFQTALDSLKNSYKRRGIEKMKNSGALASENTEGYGNSFARTSSNKAYLDAMSELASKIPAVYSAAADEFVERKNALTSLIALQQSGQQSEIEKAQLMLAAQQALDKQRFDAAAYEDAVKRKNATAFLNRYYAK